MLCDEPLRLALRNRHVEVARILLEAGANPNKRYFFGSEINLVSPLDLECMELLLAFGAHPNTRDRAGLTPLMKAARLPQVINEIVEGLSINDHREAVLLAKPIQSHLKIILKRMEESPSKGVLFFKSLWQEERISFRVQLF